jgi:hypothetical protein
MANVAPGAFDEEILAGKLAFTGRQGRAASDAGYLLSVQEWCFNPDHLVPSMAARAIKSGRLIGHGAGGSMLPQRVIAQRVAT